MEEGHLKTRDDPDDVVLGDRIGQDSAQTEDQATSRASHGHRKSSEPLGGAATTDDKSPPKKQKLSPASPKNPSTDDLIVQRLKAELDQIHESIARAKETLNATKQRLAVNQQRNRDAMAALEKKILSTDWEFTDEKHDAVFHPGVKEFENVTADIARGQLSLHHQNPGVYREVHIGCSEGEKIIVSMLRAAGRLSEDDRQILQEKFRQVTKQDIHDLE